MANSKYEYVKSFEVEDGIERGNIIVVQIDGRDFRRFSEVHGFERPNDERASKLMDECAVTVMNTDMFGDIILCYGFSDEYSFVFKKKTRFHRRRASKVLSLVASFFASIYAAKWKDVFPEKQMRYPPSFHGRVVPCPSTEVIQQYLAWRQNECDMNNELLRKEFGINYKNQPEIFSQGSCVIRVERVIKRLRRRAEKLHSTNIVATSFWNNESSLLEGVGSFERDIGEFNPDHVKFFSLDDKLKPETWIVIRIDGCNFTRFTKDHDFERPNDKQALILMNSCAEAVLLEFRDIVFAYGVSDEYSFIMNKESQLYLRRSSDIVSAIVSFFSSMYVMKWKDFMQKELQRLPSFDGRAVCYPSTQILRDYLAWRQVDCHINCQYNTCFWTLVKSGRSKSEAYEALKHTQAPQKYKLLKQFDIDYNTLPDIFRQGSSIFWKDAVSEDGAQVGELVTEHCDIIGDTFWRAHPSILMARTPEIRSEDLKRPDFNL